MLLSEKLNPHLPEIDQAANERLVQLMPPIIKAAGITHITFKQWFLLMMISKMELEQEKNINSISEVVGTSSQNIKKILISLETRGYVVIKKFVHD